MKTCKTCKFWVEKLYGYGKCNEITTKIEIELVTGWEGGYVQSIETESDFGCSIYESK